MRYNIHNNRHNETEPNALHWLNALLEDVYVRYNIHNTRHNETEPNAMQRNANMYAEPYIQGHRKVFRLEVQWGQG